MFEFISDFFLYSRHTDRLEISEEFFKLIRTWNAGSREYGR